jgi:hypothetical protein
VVGSLTSAIVTAGSLAQLGLYNSTARMALLFDGAIIFVYFA